MGTLRPIYLFKVSWHHPNDSEIDFAIQIFKDLVEPTMSLLDELLSDCTLPKSIT